MFTGIIEERGRVIEARRDEWGARLSVAAGNVADDAEIGASVAVSGVCLTVVERDGDVLSFDVVDETLRRTTLGRLEAGDAVNLERPLTLASRLGGHLVQGHADGVGTVTSVERNGAGATMDVSTPEDVRPYVVERGSIAVDGVSLTIAGVADGTFRVALVPHTLAVTTLGEREPGEGVNLEIDVVAKYVEGFVRRRG